MRILHLIAPTTSGGGPCTMRLAAEAIARMPDVRHDVVMVGSREHVTMARRAGLRPQIRLSTPLHDPVPAQRALEALLGQLEDARGRYDLLHGWSPAAAVAARSLRQRRPVLGVASDAAWPRSADVRWLSAHGVPLLALSEGVRHRLHSAGSDPKLVTLLPPGVAADTLDLSQRSALRSEWGADETTFVVGLLGDPACTLAGEMAIHAVGRPVLSGMHLKLVAHNASAGPWGLRRWLPRLDLDEMFVVDDRVDEPWQIVAGLDAAITIAPPQRRRRREFWRVSARVAPWLHRIAPGPRGPQRPGVGGLLWAMAAGVPVIAEGTPSGRELVSDRESGRVVPASDIHHMGMAIMDLHDNPAAAQRLGETARLEVRARFGPDVFAARLQVAWRSVIRREPVRFDLTPGLIETTRRTLPATPPRSLQQTL